MVTTMSNIVRDNLTSPATCLAPSCHNEATARGLCPFCYATVYREVKKGLVTWEKLESEGKVHSRSRRRNRKKAIYNWLYE